MGDQKTYVLKSSFAQKYFCSPGIVFVLLLIVTFVRCSGKTAAGADLQKQSGSGATVPVTTAQADAQDVAVELRNIGNVEAYSTVPFVPGHRPNHQGPLSRGAGKSRRRACSHHRSRPAQGALNQALADLKRDQAQLTGGEVGISTREKILENSIRFP